MALHNEGEFYGSLPAGFDGLFHWDFLDGVLPRKGKPTDIDAMIEIKRRFLFFETKKRGTEIPTGQEIALRRLGDMDPMSVFYITGKSRRDFESFTFRFGDRRCVYEGPSPDRVTSKIVGIVTKWAEAADRFQAVKEKDLREFGHICSWSGND